MDQGNLKADILKIRNRAQRVILRPSNSLSIDDPDELLLLDSMLVGLFYPNKNENKNPLLFLRRLLNTRLTYISKLRIVILIEERSKLLDNLDIVRAADVIIHEGDYDYLVNHLRHPNERPLRFSKNIKIQTLNNYERNLKFSDYIRKKTTGFKFFSLEDDVNVKYNGKDLTSQEITCKKVRVNDHVKSIILKNYNGELTSIAKSLQSFLTYSFFLHFNIDKDGIHSSEAFKDYYQFFNSNSENLSNNILNKLCYAGYIPVQIGSEEECREMIEIFNREYGKNQ